MAKILIGRKLSFLTDSVSVGGTVDVSDRAARILGHVVVDSSALPSGAATEATLADAEADLDSILAQLDVALSTRASEVTLSAINAKLNSLGQKTMAGSVPVVLASDQSTISVSATIPGTVDVSDRAARILGHVVVDSSALPTGAATEATLATRATEVTVASILAQLDVALSTRASEATLATRLADATFTSRINTLGQKVMAASTPVVISSDQSSIPVTVSGVVDVSDRAARILGHVVVDSSALPTGAATEVTLAALAASAASIDTDFDVALSTRASQVTVASILAQLDVALSTRAADRTTAAGPFSVRLSDGATFYDAVKTGQLPALLVGGKLDTNIGAWLGSTAPTVGQKTMASSLPVVIASDQSSITITGTVTANQGTPAVVGNAWPTKVSDGIDTAGISTVGAAKALKVDVVQSVGSAGSIFGAAFPATGTAAGFTDGTNMEGAKVFDADTGVGTELVLGAILRKSAAGGSVEAGTSANPLRVDPTGTTTQPVSDAAVAASVASIDADFDVALSTRASQATLATRASEATLAAAAASLVSIDTDFDVALSTRASQVTVASILAQLDVALSTRAADRTTAAAPFSVELSDGAAFYTGAKTGQFPAALVGGRLDTNIGAWLGSTAPTVGQKAMASSVPVVIASDQSAIPVSGAFTSTPNVVGTHANAWSAAVVGANGTSTAIDCQYEPFIAAFGNVSANTTITMQVSQDNANFYDSASTKITGAPADFFLFETVGARYIRLKTSGAATITATIAGKD